MNAESPDDAGEFLPPTLVVRRSEALGTFVFVPEAERSILSDLLTDEAIEFEIAVPGAGVPEIAGCRTYILGQVHPEWLVHVLVDLGVEAAVDPDSPMPEDSYHAPVDALLTLGVPGTWEDSLEYAEFGITPADVPELLRLALDEEVNSGSPESLSVYAPVHAWRALGELGATEAIIPLIGLFRWIDEQDDEWVGSELPEVLAEMGLAAIDPVADFAANRAHRQRGRAAALRSLTAIAWASPEARGECVSRLQSMLEGFEGEASEFNAFMICELLDLDAAEAAPLIERAFAAGQVDESICGDWEDVQIGLGMKSEREHPRKPNRLLELIEKLRAGASAGAVGSEGERDWIDLGPAQPVIAPPKIGRNDPCPCGSRKKFKKCCGRADNPASPE